MNMHLCWEDAESDTDFSELGISWSFSSLYLASKATYRELVLGVGDLNLWPSASQSEALPIEPPGCSAAHNWVLSCYVDDTQLLLCGWSILAVLTVFLECLFSLSHQSHWPHTSVTINKFAAWCLFFCFQRDKQLFLWIQMKQVF